MSAEAAGFAIYMLGFLCLAIGLVAGRANALTEDPLVCRASSALHDWPLIDRSVSVPTHCVIFLLLQSISEDEEGSMSDWQDASNGMWYVGGSHWGECFIERSCSEHDPAFTDCWTNGVPTITLMDGIYDFQLACALADHYNQLYTI